MFIAPILYLFIKWYDYIGVVVSFVLTGFWEMIGYSWLLTDLPYKLMIFRYISLISFGIFLAIGKAELKRSFLICCFVIGIVWQTCLNYLQLNPLFMNNPWARVNYLSCLFIASIMYMIIRKFSNLKLKCSLLKKFGKASYNIYLVQMVFYGCGGAWLVYHFVNLSILRLLICLVVCLGTGFVFYKIETPITSEIIKIMKEKCIIQKILGKISKIFTSVMVDSDFER